MGDVESNIMQDVVNEDVPIDGNIPDFSDTVQTVGRNTGAFGIWKIRVDPETLSAEIIPARNASAIGNIFDADLSQFLTVSPCANCLVVGGFTIVRDIFTIDFKLKHPFGNISSRPDLHGFDVRLIFIIQASPYIDFGLIEVMNPDGSTEPAEIAPFFILNADGYTSHFDDLILDDRYFQEGSDIPGNLNPYFRYFRNNQTPEFDPFTPVGQNVMAVGAGFDTRSVALDTDLLTEEVELFAVADVAYGQSAVFTSRQTPEYYLPAFHRTEAWRVEYWIENNTLSSVDVNSSADLVVQVFDWQHSATVDIAYPDPANPSGIPESSMVSQVELYLPQMNNSLFIETIPETGTGTPTDPLQYRFTVENTNLASHTQVGLLAVRDELYGQASPSGRMPIPITPAGFPYDTQDILDYTMYELVYINMPHPGYPHPYNGEFWMDYNPALADGTTSLYADFFMDESAKKFQYRWDFNYDGVTFDVDASGNPTDYMVFEPGYYNTALRVRTNTVPPQEYIAELELFSVGDVYNSSIPDAGSMGNMTSQTVGRNVGYADGKFYVAFTADSGGGDRSIHLAIYERDGTFSTRPISTGFSSPCFNPSIAVVNEGIYDGVYVVFEAYVGGSFNLYSTHGNLDGSGFEVANIKSVDADPTHYSYWVDLIYKNGNLYAYFTGEGGGGANISLSISTDLASTWTVPVTINDNTTGWQIRPAAVYSSDLGKTYCVWEDYSIPGQGSELIMAESSNSVDFGDDTNISAFPDLMYERYANVTSNHYELIIAYQAEDASNKRDVYIKSMNLDGLFLDYKVRYMGSSNRMTKPAIASSVKGHYILSYGLYNEISQDFQAVALSVKAGTTLDTWRENPILTPAIGNVVSNAAEIYPGIISNSVSDTLGSENFIVYMDYSAGANESTNPFSMFFGDIKVQYIITGVIY